jgi:hypothetical protein
LNRLRDRRQRGDHRDHGLGLLHAGDLPGPQWDGADDGEPAERHDQSTGNDLPGGSAHPSSPEGVGGVRFAAGRGRYHPRPFVSAPVSPGRFGRTDPDRG